MLFNNSKESFFLNLESGSDQSKAVVLTPPLNRSSDQSTEEQPSAPAEMSLTITAVSQAASKADVATVTPEPVEAASSPATSAATKAAQAAPVQTTAEAIAAQLAAEQAARPVAPMTTFAPDFLLPGNGLVQRRRRPGASMMSYRTLAGDLFKS